CVSSAAKRSSGSFGFMDFREVDEGISSLESTGSLASWEGRFQCVLYMFQKNSATPRTTRLPPHCRRRCDPHIRRDPRQGKREQGMAMTLAPAKLGLKAPDFRLPATDGRTYSL